MRRSNHWVGHSLVSLFLCFPLPLIKTRNEHGERKISIIFLGNISDFLYREDSKGKPQQKAFLRMAIEKNKIDNALKPFEHGKGL